MIQVYNDVPRKVFPSVVSFLTAGDTCNNRIVSAIHVHASKWDIQNGEERGWKTRIGY
jgi:hypothetical protein